MERGGTELAGRYAIEASLGKGGMGAVHRALDHQTGRRVALKRMLASDRKQERLLAFFEREFRTLSQLAHPSVIEVYEYGFADDGLPFYTMELLDGEDLSARAPLHPVQACVLLHDVASSLALLHARGFVHRDVTARNIRIVAEDRAKLIDFGAITPMGPCDEVAGTPMYVAPEVVLGQRIDGRADLYSLGVVLYYALTKRFPYRARTLRELRAAWHEAPTSPSQLTRGLPEDLVRLTMSLLSLDRSARPRSAAEVMERLAALGGFPQGEAPAASRAYLNAPALEGRSQAQQRLRGATVGAVRGSGGSVVFAGDAGLGRSRMLDAGVLEAKVLGATVVRVGAQHSHGHGFDAARALVEQLLAADREAAQRCAREHWSACQVLFVDDAIESVAELAGKASRLDTLAALKRFFTAYARKQTLVIVADDLALLDEPSLALLVTLIAAARSRRLLILGALDEASVTDGPMSLQLIHEEAGVCELAPLDAAATRRLLASVFGAVPNLDVVADQVQRLSRGYPREIMMLAEHLVERGIVGYAGGTWVLPQALDGDALPSSLTYALAQRTQELSPLALGIARCHALSPLGSMELAELVALGAPAGAGDAYAAVDELVMSGVVTASNQGYVIGHEGWGAVLLQDLDDTERARRHLDLARMHDARGGDRLLVAHHFMLGGEQDRALEVLDSFCREYSLETAEVFDASRLGAGPLARLFADARRAAEALRPGSALQVRLNQFVLAAGTLVEPQLFFDVAPDVERALLAHSGYDHWQTLEPTLPPMDRVLQALQHAQGVYEATPERERGPHPAHALKSLAQFAVASLAVSMASCDFERLRRMPGLLEPFAPLSPILEALMNNLTAVVETINGDLARSRDLYLQVLEQLADVDASALEHVDAIRAGVTFGIAVAESRMGMLDASTARLDTIADNRQMRGNVLGLRAILALHRGDWGAAAALKRRARRVCVESDAALVFGHDHLPSEIELCALGLDLDAVKRLCGEVQALAQRFTGWRAVHAMAQADLARLRGDLVGALEHAERAVALCGGGEGVPPSLPWHHAASSKIELLAELGRTKEAVAYGRSLIGEDQPAGQRHHRTVRALALAEAAAGEHEIASERLSDLLERLTLWGARGVELGLVHEALAWCALRAGDRAAFRVHATHTATEYHLSDDSGFAARYERLRHAIRGTQLVSDIPPPQSFEGASQMSSQLTQVSARVQSTIDACSERRDRAARGLALLCEVAGAGSGFLYLLDADGLERAALVPGSLPGPGLDAMVAGALESETALEEQPTLTSVLTGDLNAQLGAEPKPWVDAQGRHHHLLRIRARLAGESALVGVAVLQARDACSWSPEVVECAAALGEGFVRAGDATTACTTLNEPARASGRVAAR